MSTPQKPVLILDADMVPALTAARSLYDKGIPVDLAYSQRCMERPLSTWSRSCGSVLRYPDPLESPAEFVQWINERVNENRYRLIIPVTERSLVVLARNLSTSTLNDHLAIPPTEALEKVLDKSLTLELADKLGIPYPARHRIDSSARLDELLATSQLNFPLVLKPVSSISGTKRKNVFTQLHVDYAFDEEELLTKGHELLEVTPLLIQEYVSGRGVGIEVIAKHGNVVFAFQHRRIHELPLSGGGSTYRESVQINPDMREAAERLVKALGWHGVAMVEFKHDEESGHFWLMEINGRFWGSLPLSVAAGADFPWLLYQLHTTGTVADKLPPPTPGIHCRKLSADLAWYEQVMRGHYDPRLFHRPPGRQLLSQTLRAFTPGHRFDVQSLSDPVPGIVDFYRIMRSQARRLGSILHERRRRRHLASKREQRRILALFRRTQRLLFVCYGNINRSALAEALLKKELPTTAAPLEVRSAGFHPIEGRPADPNMQKVARAHQLDLSSASSRLLTTEMLRWADMVFVMELKHMEAIEEMAVPGAPDKTALLGSLAPVGGNPEIADPYGGAPAAYESCYEQISQCIGKLLQYRN